MSVGGGYENAPATRMLATNCACCARPLCDSVSVESGIGPDCRRKHGYNLDVPPAVRDEANQLVHDVAVQQEGLAVAQAVARLRELGFERLAAVIAKRACRVRIREGEHEGRAGVFVASPYSEDATAGFRAISGRRWVSESKENFFPAHERRRLWIVLARAYRGETAIGPKGPFVLEIVS